MTPVAGSRWLACAVLAACAISAATGAAAQQPAHGSANFSQAESLFREHRLAEAKTEALAQLALDPKSVEGLNLLGMIEGAQSDFDGARASFEKALQIAPNSAKSRNNLGNIDAATGHFDWAEKEFRAVLRSYPADGEANYNLGTLLVARGAGAAAIPHLLRVHPQATETSYQLIHAYLETGRTAEALKLAGELSGQNKNNLQIHFSLGTLLASEKQYDAARRELEMADALAPGTFEILFNLGQTLLRSGQFAESELVLNRALRLKPDSVETLTLLAQAAINQSHPLDALDLLIRAHRLEPQNVDVIYLMALVSMSQNYFEDAIPLLESGVQLAPHRADLVAALGESYFMAGKVDKAIEQFHKLIEIEGSARSYAYLGLAYRQLGRFDEARLSFAQGLKLDARNTLCLFNLGYIAERQGNATQAAAIFEKVLVIDPNYPEALLELANLRAAGGKPDLAVALLKRFVKVSRDPATGYYKLAMVERSLHRTAESNQDLNSFKILSRSAPSGPLPFEHLFDYLDNRSKLAPSDKTKLDLDDLKAEVQRHPDRPENLYMLTEAYIKAGDLDNARATVAQLDALAANDDRNLAGVGVLLARYRFYDDAIQQFNSALAVNPAADDVRFDLANAYFKKQLYAQALDAAQQISPEGVKDDATQALLADIYAHTGDSARAAAIFQALIGHNPDDDQYYLSLALLELRQNRLDPARETLVKGRSRIPESGKLLWGLGLTLALEGKTAEAAAQLERAVDLLPEWPGAYSTLGVFYFEAGQIDKAREVLERFKNSSSSATLDVGRIEQVLDQAEQTAVSPDAPMEMEKRAQLLQFALSVADKTL
jgi:tetratricopeptide (TPR) repeat protein